MCSQLSPTQKNQQNVGQLLLLPSPLLLLLNYPAAGGTCNDVAGRNASCEDCWRVRDHPIPINTKRKRKIKQVEKEREEMFMQLRVLV